MAFRNMQHIRLSLLLFLHFCLSVFPDKTAGVSIREKCMCIQESFPIPWKYMTDFKVIDSGPHCKKVQIIISMGRKDVCLAPNSKQGKKLQQCWKRINFNEKKKKVCLSPGKIKRRQKKANPP